MLRDKKKSPSPRRIHSISPLYLSLLFRLPAAGRGSRRSVRRPLRYRLPSASPLAPWLTAPLYTRDIEERNGREIVKRIMKASNMNK